jgi:hypothetical protein
MKLKVNITTALDEIGRESVDCIYLLMEESSARLKYIYGYVP